MQRKNENELTFFPLFQSFFCRHTVTMIRHKFEFIVTLVLICFAELVSTKSKELNNNYNSNNTYIATNCSDVATTDCDVYETSDDDDRILSRQKRNFGGREPIDYVKVSISPTFFVSTSVLKLNTLSFKASSHLTPNIMIKRYFIHQLDNV